MERANVDTAEITHISLCSGYGGIDLGLRRCIPLRTVAYAEIEAFAIECLLARMEGGQLDAAPIWTDLRSFPWSEFSGKVDILSGGYPCQPFSAAGKRLGTEDERHLWPHIAKGIAILKPRVCLFENVEGHITLGLSTVISDLEEMGYKVSWGIFSAAQCGAPHQRKRVFIMAVAGGIGGTTRFSGQITGHEGQSGITYYCGAQAWPSRPGQPQHAWEPPRVVGNANGSRPQERQGQGGSGLQGADSDGGEDASRQAQPTLGGDVDGITDRLDDAELYVTCDNRTDELRLLGNGVVPATAALAFITLLNEQRNTRHLVGDAS
jgi:DNA (cytosine-5)-methyltransferase 1